MKFFAKIRDIMIRFLTKITCNSSCFNTDNHVENKYVICNNCGSKEALNNLEHLVEPGHTDR